jgi:hypothetical protein
MLNVLIDVMINAGAFLKSLNHPLTPQPPRRGAKNWEESKVPPRGFRGNKKEDAIGILMEKKESIKYCKK